MKFLHKNKLGDRWYTITETFPEGYHVWPIGEDNAPDGYLPLCRSLHDPCRPFAIDPETLLALPVSDEVRRVALRKAVKREIDREEFETIVKIVELSLQSHKTN